ncbi:Arginine permease [Podosphaera aphanis]|nr:Arginine permease [Podosphaera aphanis]
MSLNKIEKSPNVDVDSERSQDAEKHGQQIGELKRELKARHIQMIAIGGTIGTGLFIGSGSALAMAGPAGALLAYAFVGTVVFSVMNSLGEMATYIPISGAFTKYATRFISPSLGFAMGWIYWFSWATTYALELTATGLIIQYWVPQLNIGVSIGAFFVILTAINLLPVSYFGELEFWLSLIKVITVLGFVIFAIVIDAGAGKNGYLGFSYWKSPGAFAPYLITTSPAVGKFVGFWAVLIQAGFSFEGTELVGIAAGECENPRKNMPKAIKKSFIRILVLFILTIFSIGLLIPYDNKSLVSGSSDASASPFVIAAKLAGVKGLPGVINSVLLVVVLTAANSNIYSGSRILVGLADEGSAPAFFGRTTKSGVPYVAVGVTSAFGLLAFLNESDRGGDVFTWLMNMSAVAGFINWGCISGCHIKFMRALEAHGILREELPFCAIGGKWFAYYGLFFSVLITITQGFTAFIPWDTTAFLTSYISVVIFLVSLFGHVLLKKTKIVRAIDADIVTGRLPDEKFGSGTAKPKTMLKRIGAWL